MGCLSLRGTESRKEEFIGPRTRPAYPPEAPTKEFEPSAQTIPTRADQGRVGTGERPGLTRDEKEELAQPRRGVKHLLEEKEILRTATVFFIRETSR
ncbi:hypothetical protein ABZ892_07950 [Streptomyces sp. NPDC046924]|uniref:hypothetical protein n=1 Tax=Streptomyces sp. NPDC046924 TaxID=3155136 RepID=UPI0033F15C68